MKRHSRTEKVIYLFILLILSVATIEGSLHLMYTILTHQPFPFSRYDDTLRRMASRVNSPEADGELGPGEIPGGQNIIEVIHPYLGFVRDPARTPDTSYWGFPQKNDDPLLRTDNSVTVAVFGGSFAEGMSIIGQPALESALRDHGVNARILTLAMGGYKQPQQLLTLAYLLSHGAAFDVVVNIDGFNEVVLPQVENVPKKINPFYPRAWYERALLLRDQVTLRQIGFIAALQDDRRRWATVFRPLPKFSIIRNIAWLAYDQLLEYRIMVLNEQIRRSQPLSSNQFLRVGPDLGIRNEAELYDRIANHWTISSVLMKSLCDSRGIAYIHILQPNQYFQTERALTEEERRNAFREDHIYRAGVVKGYPRLLMKEVDLLRAGVNFHDLTKIYDDFPQTIYQDSCCHPNKLGYQIVAKYVAQTIAEVIR
jgi:hypothetical protein